MIHDDLPRQARDKRKETFLYTGFVDLGGGTHCGQSFWCETRTPFSLCHRQNDGNPLICQGRLGTDMTRNGQPVVFIGRDPKGRRVQFMWLMIALPNATWSGAPTLPREIVLAPPGSAVTGLYFRPLPEMQLLHVGEASNTSLALRSSTTTTGGAGGGGASGGASGGGAAAAAGGGGGAAAVGSSSSSDSDTWQEIHVADGLHCHVVMSLTIPSVSTVVSIELRAGGAAPHAPGSVMLNVSREKSPCCFDVDQNDPWFWIYEMNQTTICQDRLGTTMICQRFFFDPTRWDRHVGRAVIRPRCPKPSNLCATYF
jgi:hypothetical protein